MDIKPILQSQYLASLEMLEDVIQHCPVEEWDNSSDLNRFWHVVYHALFYTHLYLQPEERDFQPWEKHRSELTSLSHGEVMPLGLEPYTKYDLLRYLEHCRMIVHAVLPILDLEAESGFYWLPMTKFELQFYTIRHLQHHIGELFDRLGTRSGLDLTWIGMGEFDEEYE
jgi:hypothetical protein